MTLLFPFISQQKASFDQELADDICASPSDKQNGNGVAWANRLPLRSRFARWRWLEIPEALWAVDDFTSNFRDTGAEDPISLIHSRARRELGRILQPFVIKSTTQFRCRRHLPFPAPAYTTADNEVKNSGATGLLRRAAHARANLYRTFGHTMERPACVRRRESIIRLQFHCRPNKNPAHRAGAAGLRWSMCPWRRASVYGNRIITIFGADNWNSRIRSPPILPPSPPNPPPPPMARGQRALVDNNELQLANPTSLR